MNTSHDLVPAEPRVVGLGRVLLFAGAIFLIAALWVVWSLAAPEVIRLHLDDLTKEGLRGPADGLRAVSYEFCIPAAEKNVAEVRNLDPTAEVYRESPGRVDCSADEYLVVGSTHQPEFRTVLENLSELPYVHRIQEAYFE